MRIDPTTFKQHTYTAELNRYNKRLNLILTINTTPIITVIKTIIVLYSLKTQSMRNNSKYSNP